MLVSPHDMTAVYAIFHLNLAFSSIAEEKRAEVIERCYVPLLDLVEFHALPVGIELTGWTLRQIESINPSWVQRFKKLLSEKRCELIGSGYTQMIGPLVPYEVNLWNQRLGLECYEEILQVCPRLALVNEMAFSSGMVEVYHTAGYAGIVMDRDNIILALQTDEAGRQPPNMAQGCSGTEIPVLWSDTVMFQKLQRYAHGDISFADYCDYFTKRLATAQVLPLYSNDAEIFNYRPGRFAEEALLHQDNEWQRVAELFVTLPEQYPLRWVLPSEAILIQDDAEKLTNSSRLTSSFQPIPVKKQAKYNISRWAVSGRDDLRMNTLCHRIYHALRRSEDKASWRRLCELWASDLRTHIGEPRWELSQQALQKLCTDLGVSSTTDNRTFITHPERDHEALGFMVRTENEGTALVVEHATVKLVLNLRRGLCIERLAFKKHDFEPVLGTLPQGYFSAIELAADYYSGALVMEMPKVHKRLTDLEWVNPEFSVVANTLLISSLLETPFGNIRKSIQLDPDAESVSLHIALENWTAQHEVVRLNAATLLEAWQNNVVVESRSGGPESELFSLEGEIDHGRPASTIVSCTTGLGGEAGELVLFKGEKTLRLSWDPALCAAFPLLYHKPCSPGSLSRVIFSLSELDETRKNSGELLPLSLKYSAS